MEALRDGDPTRLGPYRLRGRLGEGGMGEVFLGTSPSGVRVAVKTVRAEFATDHGFRDRFRREVDLARRVDSAWTAPIAEADPDAQPPWLATEYLTGLSLSEAITRYGPLPEGALRVLGAQLAEALMAIHRAGLIHRDLKPSNVMLSRDRLRVIDFGISRAVDEGGRGPTGTGRVVGSPAFMSPEQADGRTLGPASDVFSLGSVLVFAATGRGPFHQDPPVPQLQMMLRVLRDKPLLADVPDGVRDLLAECLDKDPTRRPEPVTVLERCLGDDEPPPVTSWLPAGLAAELERRHLRDPAAPAEATNEAPEPPTRALGIGADNGAPTATTRAAPAGSGGPGTSGEPTGPTGPTGPPPQPSLPPTVGMPEPPVGKRALARRSLLLGGGALVVAAAGGGIGWLLASDETNPGKQVWSYPAGPAAGSSLSVQGDLVYHVAEGVGGGKGQVTAIDAESGKQVWRKATTGSSVSAPLTTKSHVFVVSWTVDTSALVPEPSQPSTCTVHAFDPFNGEQRWVLEYAARWVNLPAGLDGELLYLGVAEENSSSTGPGRIVAINATTHREVWKADMSKDTGLPATPVFAGGLVYVLAEPRYSSYPAVIRAYDRGGSPKWEIPFKDCPWGRNVVPAGNQVLALVTSGRSGGAYTWQRYARDATTGAALWGPIPVEGGPSNGLTLAGDTAFLVYDAADDEAESGVVAVDPLTGAQVWKYEMETRNVSGIARVDDVVYVASHPSEPQAGVLPSTTGGASPTNGPAGSVNKGAVHALEAKTGNVVWKREMPSHGALETPVVADGKVYVSMDATSTGATGDDAAHLIALRAKTGEPAWQVALPAPVSSRVVSAKGNVYLGQWQRPDAPKPAASVVAYEG
ncbi:protein kinase domain-containing protein [Embleya scabrispora]|uniref:protein kinase domain-containing protein n=1 Tax=Embleya scabrispora TaxID=159449 RepID=UPI0003A18DFA|nr:PQQ-binding-like beta-propeller repeat protein [Embleya scabrispora]MYS82007.1 PQQ-binding-like beta-propeller repeat protein [Streptomyces sp. SID5474]